MGLNMAFGQGEKDCLERFKRLDCRKMQHTGALNAGNRGNWAWFDTKTNEKMGEISYESQPHHLTLSYTVNDQQHRYSIELERMACNYGGSRVWFHCPVVGCGKRVAILFLKGGIFACRHCQRLNYQSQQLAKSDQHRLRMHRIRGRLNWPIYCDVPFMKYITKPKGMHHATFERLKQEHDRHERKHINVMIGGLNRIQGMAGGDKWDLLPEL